MIFDESRRSGALRMNMEMTGTRRMRIDITVSLHDDYLPPHRSGLDPIVERVSRWHLPQQRQLSAVLVPFGAPSLTSQSDVICPFCLLGVKQLLIALEQYNSAHPTLPLRADIRLLPFQLNPALTDQPVDRSTYLRDKFGPRADAMSKAMADKMATMGYQL